jgi:hypothetical protein
VLLRFYDASKEVRHMDESTYYTPEQLRAELIRRGLAPESADHLIAVCPVVLKSDVDDDSLPLSKMHPEVWSLVIQIAELCRWGHAYDLRITLTSPKTKGKVASFTIENPDRPHLIRVLKSDVPG